MKGERSEWEEIWEEAEVEVAAAHRATTPVRELSLGGKWMAGISWAVLVIGVWAVLLIDVWG